MGTSQARLELEPSIYQLMLRSGWRRTGPTRPRAGAYPVANAFGARQPGPPPRGLCAVGWPRVGLSGDRTRVNHQHK